MSSLTVTYAPYESHLSYPALYLAGEAEETDWQEELITRLNDSKCSLHIINPRPQRPNLTYFQSKEYSIWRYNHMKLADAILFWFPNDHMYPKLMYELGVQLGINSSRQTDYGFWANNKAIFVGTHPQQIYHDDIDIWTKQVLGEQFEIARSIQYLAQQIITFSRALDR